MQINLQTKIADLKGQSFVLLQDGSVKLCGTQSDLYISAEIFAMLKTEFAKAELKPDEKPKAGVKYRDLSGFVINRRVKNISGKEFVRYEVRLGCTL